MAAIDKIYGSPKEYAQFEKWATDNKPELLQYFQGCYPRGNTTAITNFPENEDRWLLKNCPIAWVIERINEQYGIVPRNKRNRGDIRPPKGRRRRYT